MHGGHPFSSTAFGSNRLFTEGPYYVYILFSEQKFSVKENKSKNAEDAEKFVDDDIPSPECLVIVMSSKCDGGPGISD
jgi:hypothetical protein